ncbi:hypothetical protein IC798_05410 [Acinetobacter seifertii]|uniref:hypothetical protein n=1 Tax=Acinetobacter seifertii TaxID=1530123 RepID=UPI00168D1004|nr:hypothetical protein [Acinetobacter seifertii]QNX02774.1 hypothetical protein IC798_05410 [Acinetobacter seifertii]
MTNEQFHAVVRSRLNAPDFAQSQEQSGMNIFRDKALDQIDKALKKISEARTRDGLLIAQTEAHAFVNASYDFEVINLKEKQSFEMKIRRAYRNQVISDSHDPA